MPASEQALPARVPVLIAGGGTVGLYLAVELGYYGLETLLVTEGRTTSQHPKGSTINARSMEHLRRLGLAPKVRRIGIPRDQNTDITFITRFTGYELGRIEMPSLEQKIGNPGPWGDTLLTPEPIHRANQMYLEPLLREAAEQCATNRLEFGWRLSAFEEHADGVHCEITQVDTGKTHAVIADYLIGCDGANGLTRRQLGFKYSGRNSSGDGFYDGRMLSIYVRAPAVFEVLNFPRSWHYVTVNHDTRMDCISLDGAGEFVILAHVPQDLPLEEIDTLALFRRAVGAEIEAEIVSVNEWWAGLALVTDRYQHGRTYLAGDSIHLFTPTGGFGFNTGIDDAANLAWKLAAACQGWGSAALVATYETERRPIGLRNTQESGNLAAQAAALLVPPHIEDATPAGDAERAALHIELARYREEFASLGIQLGARYDGSPIIVADGATPPADEPKRYIPSAVPGGRAPHYWINDRESLFDRFAFGFTLLCTGEESAATTGFEQAAQALGIPLGVVTLDAAGLAELYEQPFTLIRPDRHICWRGAALPADAAALLRQVTGRGGE